MRSALALGALLVLLPTAAACEGLSPGDNLLTDEGSCTLAFLLAGKDGLYFATAGHCIREGQAARHPDLGTFGTGAFRHLVPDTGSVSDGSPGEDFGLIRIDPAFYDKLNPKMCGWDGPTGLYETTPGSGGVRHFGHGMILGETDATRPREGYFLSNDNVAFHWLGAGVPGDSGSAVVHENGAALGVLTHLQVRPGETNGGTHLLRGYALVKEKMDLDLRLILMGEDPLAVLREMENTQPPADPSTPAPTPTPTQEPADPSDPTPANPTPAPPPEEPVAPAAGFDQDDGGTPPGEKAGVPGPGLAALLVALVVAARRARR